MDLAVFRPLKQFWKNAVYEWKMENLGQNIRKENFAPVLKRAIEKLTPNCLKNGFRAEGICPFGPEYIDMSKIKHREKVSDCSGKPALTEFLKCLEKEIVKVFTAEKLSLFNKFYYEGRKPEEDTALYIIWSKNKHDCENDFEANSVTPAIQLINDSDLETTLNSETTSAPTTCAPPQLSIEYLSVSEGTSHPTIDEPPSSESTNVMPIVVGNSSTSHNNSKSPLASNTLAETTAAPLMTTLPKSDPTRDSSVDVENGGPSQNISQIKSRPTIGEPPRQITSETGNVMLVV
ncbi:unnamed protein product [Colias eurytheme]|nr:unnamed protein product [Colias eurytheme]